MVLETLLPDAQNIQRSINGAINNKTPRLQTWNSQ
jgi:hypothetical protein